MQLVDGLGRQATAAWVEETLVEGLKVVGPERAEIAARDILEAIERISGWDQPAPKE